MVSQSENASGDVVCTAKKRAFQKCLYCDMTVISVTVPFQPLMKNGGRVAI